MGLIHLLTRLFIIFKSMTTSKYTFINLGVKQLRETTARTLHEGEELYKRRADLGSLNTFVSYIANDPRSNINNPSNWLAIPTLKLQNQHSVING